MGGRRLRLESSPPAVLLARGGGGERRPGKLTRVQSTYSVWSCVSPQGNVGYSAGRMKTLPRLPIVLPCYRLGRSKIIVESPKRCSRGGGCKVSYTAPAIRHVHAFYNRLYSLYIFCLSLFTVPTITLLEYTRVRCTWCDIEILQFWTIGTFAYFLNIVVMMQLKCSEQLELLHTF